MFQRSYIVIASLFIVVYHGKPTEDFIQAMAKIKCVNPKYMHDVKVWTYRDSRYSPYLTSLNYTALQSWTNNVTTVINVYDEKNRNAVLMHLPIRICDAMKQKWVTSWLKIHSNIPISCIVPPGSYQFNRVELPPKGIPLILQQKDYFVQIMIIMTQTKEVLGVGDIVLYSKK